MTNPRLLLLGAIAVAGLAPGAFGASSQEPAPEAVRRASAMQAERLAARARLEPMGALRGAGRAGKLSLAPGDLLSATSSRSRVVQISDDGAEVRFARLRGAGLVPRGIDHDPVTGLVAIAAVNQVVLYDPIAGAYTQILPESGAFDFANDVVFDTLGNLLIADMGEVTGARKPQDGAIWRYVLTTADLEVIPAKKKLSDPKLLARDAKGTIFFLDGEAGDLAAPPFDVRWDVLYEIGGAKQNKFRVTWSEPGLQGTAYAIDSSGWHWVVNLAELVRVKGGKIRNPCLPPYPMAFATGLAFSPGGDAHVSDGSDVVGRARRVAELDSECVATPVASARLNGIRGLAGVDSE